MALKVGDRVKVLSISLVAQVWRGREGKITRVYGEIWPFMFEVVVPAVGRRPYTLLFKGDQLEKIGGEENDR